MGRCCGERSRRNRSELYKYEVLWRNLFSMFWTTRQMTQSTVYKSTRCMQKNNDEVTEQDKASDFDSVRHQRDDTIRSELKSAGASAQRAVETFAHKQQAAAEQLSFKAVDARIKLPPGFGQRVLQRALDREARASSLLESGAQRENLKNGVKSSNNPYASLVSMSDEDATSLLPRDRAGFDASADAVKADSVAQYVGTSQGDRLLAERDAAENAYRRFLAAKRHRLRGNR